MEGSQLSFIPKKNLTAPVSKESGMSFLVTLSIIVFVASAIIYGGVFLYQSALDSSIKTKTEDLNTKKNELDQTTIDGIYKVSQRIEALKAVLANHRSIAPFFNYLGQNTLTGVRFLSFNYSDTGDNPIVALTGVAKDYGSIALQSKKFGENPLLTSSFSGFSLKDGGLVNFSVKITSDPAQFSYKPSDTQANGQ